MFAALLVFLCILPLCITKNHVKMYLKLYKVACTTSIQSTNTFAIFDHMFAPIIMVQLAKLHQYFCARDMAAPIGEETLTSCKYSDFADFFYVCSTSTLVDSLQHQYIGALQSDTKC